MLNIIQVLRSKSVADQARLLGNIRNYVKNDGLVNLLANFDLNDKKGDKMMNLQIQAFEGVPDLKEQVAVWLSS
jgi:hypothetical protein